MSDFPNFAQTSAQYNHEPSLAPLFFMHEGIECVKVMKAGDSRTISVFPADSTYDVNEFGEPMTYAERWPNQYAQFKNNSTQVADGTPLSEAPFLNPSRINDLNAIKVFTLEALANYDDRYISRMGGNGYRLKTMAQEFLEKRAAMGGGEDVEALKARIAALEAQQQAPKSDPYEGVSDEELKARIKEATGSHVRGPVKRETLTSMMRDLESEKAA